MVLLDIIVCFVPKLKLREVSVMEFGVLKLPLMSLMEIQLASGDSIQLDVYFFGWSDWIKDRS